MAVSLAVAAFASADLSAQAPLRKLGEMDLTVVGLAATADPTSPVVPKNTSAGIRIAVHGGSADLALDDVRRLLGHDVVVVGDLTGPGLNAPREVTSRVAQGVPADPLLLPLPALASAGNYQLSNLRLMSGDPSHTVLDVTPSRVNVEVVEQVLVTSVTTRPLTLDEIRDKGIVLDRDDYLGFEFTMGLRLESRPVELKFPVVFNRQGLPLPEFTHMAPTAPMPDLDLPSLPSIVPMMLEIEKPSGATRLGGLDSVLADVRIPSLLVNPGSVGALKQFFSAQLFVANGAPTRSGLTLRGTKATIVLPHGRPGTTGDPLSLPNTGNGPAPSTLAIAGVGADGQAGTPDDVSVLAPGQQGQAEFVVRGEQEGFHTLNFDIEGVLEGLQIGPVNVKGRATGGVLVRNANFDLTFTVPSVVRRNEPFKLFVTVTNKGSGIGNDLDVTFDPADLGNVHIIGSPTRNIPTLQPGDSKTLQFDMAAERTGAVTASYLRFDANDVATSGRLRFDIGVGERGIALSPDTLVLPAAIDELPADVVDAAMRVLGQAWSVSNTSGPLPAGVTRISKTTTTAKALALAEAGLRVSFGQPVADSLRDLVTDFYGPTQTAVGAPLDPGFDQLLRTTNAGWEFARAVGAHVSDAVLTAGGAVEYLRDWQDVLASGSDHLTIATTAAPIDLVISDRDTRHLETAISAGASPRREIAGGIVLPLGSGSDVARLGYIASVGDGPYVVELSGRGAATVDLAVGIPAGDGTIRRGTLTGIPVAQGSRARITVVVGSSSGLTLAQDLDGNGEFESQLPLTLASVAPQGPGLVTAATVGPETFQTAGPFGMHVALMFDRAVDATSAADPAHFSIPKNHFTIVKRALSGRFVLGQLERPEGRHVPTTVQADAIDDLRGATRTTASVPLQSRIDDAGAVVTGRVFSADGSPLGAIELFYSQNLNLGCNPVAADQYLTKFATEADGRFEVRWVRQDQCGQPFRILARDPVGGALRSIARTVRADGERIVADLALFGRGGVTGVVRSGGQPLGGAHVTAISSVDPSISAEALTDGEGKYTIPGLLVGPVTVRVVAVIQSVKRQGAGSGVILSAGTNATVDVTLAYDTGSVSGVAERVSGGAPSPAAGALVLYKIQNSSGGDYVPVAGQFTGDDGTFAFADVPSGNFVLDVTLNTSTRDTASMVGVLAPGESLTGRRVVVNTLQTATVSGHVVRRTSGGTDQAVPGALVAIGDNGALTDANGYFTLERIAVRPSQPYSVIARTSDGRTGNATVLVSQSSGVDNVVVTLSSLGRARFTVLDGAGNAIPQQNVAALADSFALGGSCGSGCGCALQILATDSNGVVTFDNLPAGRVTVRATRTAAGFIEVAEAIAIVPGEDLLGEGIVRFSGSGLITGKVLEPHPSTTGIHGADIEVRSRRFDAASCRMVESPSHYTRTDLNGNFRLAGVGIGPVSVTASHTGYTTKVAAQLTLTHVGEERNVTLQLVDTTAGKLTGTVYLPESDIPVGAGVEVTARGVLPDVTVRTSELGAFKLENILPQGTYSLTARDLATGNVVRDFVALTAGENVTHDLRLKGRGTVRVHLLDALDNPIYPAVVTLRESEFPNRSFDAAADDSNRGVVTFDRVFEGPLSLEISDLHGRGGRASAVLPRSGATIDVNVRVTATGTVRGRFLLADGVTPVPLGSVKLTAAGRIIGETTTSGFGDPGAFEFDYVPAGQVRLEALDPTTGRTGAASGTLAFDGDVLTLDVRAVGLGVVTGRVTAGVNPQAGVSVSVSSGSTRVTTTTNDSGDYTVDGIPEGLVSVVATALGGIQSGQASGLLVGDRTTLSLNVALSQTGRVHGTLTAATGGPPPATVITARVGGFAFNTGTDENGAFAFEHLPIGRATLSAEVVGSIDKGHAEVDVVGGSEVVANITLSGIGAIEGHAYAGPDEVTAGTLVIRGTGPIPYSISVSAGADGLFRLPEVLAGPFTITLESRVGEIRLFGSTNGVLPPRTSPTDAPLVVNVFLQPTTTVTAQVLRADGATPAVAADVTLLVAGGQQVAVPVLANGRFTALGVPIGNLDLRVRDPFTGGVAFVPNVTTVLGQPLDLGTITLDDGPISVLATDPVDGTVNIALDRAVVVTLSDPVQNTAAISIMNGTASVPVQRALSSDGRTVTLTPIATKWPDSVELTVQVSTALTDVYGRHPLQPYTSGFRTKDETPAFVVSTTPVDGAVQVPNALVLDVTFNEPLAPGTELDELIIVTLSGVDVPGAVELIAPNVARYTPTTALQDDHVYLATIAGAIDMAGNEPGAARVISLATRDTVAPTLVFGSLSPFTDGWTRAARPNLRVSFSDEVSGIQNASGTMAIDGLTAAAPQFPSYLEFVPPTDLVEGMHTLDASIADRAGNIGVLATVHFGVDTIGPDPAVLSGVIEGQVVAGSVAISADSADASSGLGFIDVLRDGTFVLRLPAPTFSGALSTVGMSDGPHTLSARGVDVAGNIGAAGPVVGIVVNNTPIQVTLTSPAPNTRTRGTIAAAATVSEPAKRVEFTFAGSTVVDESAPFTASFDTTTVAEGSHQLVARAIDQFDLDDTDEVSIVVDRTAPTAPDASRINAEPPVGGVSLVHGSAGAVESMAAVEVTHTTSSVTSMAARQADGSFATSIAAAIDDLLSLVAIDQAGNRSAATVVAVRQLPSTTETGAGLLRFEGTPVDRVNGGSVATALASDGVADAVFTFTMSIAGEGSRQLQSIALASISAQTGQATVIRGTSSPATVGLGVADSQDEPFLNGATGGIALTVSGTRTLSLIAHKGTQLAEGGTYRVTATFADGSRIAAEAYLTPTSDRAQIAHSATVTPSSWTVIGSAGTPGTAQIEVTDIRDIDGTLVPDGARIALAVANGAALDAYGNPVSSAGGEITDGVTALNRSDFKVFTVQGGSVSATYSSGGITPPVNDGVGVVIQMLAADAAGNVLGQRLAASQDIAVHRVTDRAIVHVAPGSIYSDKSARHATVTVFVRNAAGQPVPDGTRVYLLASPGEILGGELTSGSYKGFNVTNGQVTTEFSALNLAAFPGSGVIRPSISVYAANSSGGVDFNGLMGRGSITLTSPGGAEFRSSLASVPWVFPARQTQIVVHHIHDIRANLVPDGAKFILNPDQRWNYHGQTLTSDGGKIIDGDDSPGDIALRVFALNMARFVGTFSPESLILQPGDVKSSAVALAAADTTGARIDAINNRAFGVLRLPIVAPLNSVGISDPASLTADGVIRTSTVTFGPVLDAFGNQLPNGSLVAATASGATLPGTSTHIPSIGGELSGGALIGTGPMRYYTVEDGAVTIGYATTVALQQHPGQTATARISLLEARRDPSNQVVTANTGALGTVPVTLAGLTSAEAVASPSALYADSAERISQVTFSNFRDALGNPVPDGAKIAATVNGQGSIAGGAVPPAGQFAAYRTFVVANGQIVVPYSSQGVAAPQTSAATVQAFVAGPNNNPFNTSTSLASATITLLAPATGAVMTVNPADLVGDGGPHQSQVVITNLRDTAGNPIPDGAKVVLVLPSTGGNDALITANVTPGDGTPVPNANSQWSFTVAGGAVRAIYVSYSGSGQRWVVTPGNNTDRQINAYPGTAQGTVLTFSTLLANGLVRLHGVTSAVSNAPASVARGSTTDIIFSAIKDNVGNTVPDGTKLAVELVNSTSGTLSGGVQVQPGYRVYTVVDGQITIPFTAGTGTSPATIVLWSADYDGLRTGSALSSGTITITLTP